MSQKLLADSNRASLREIVEANANWGETPVSGVSRNIRFTTSSITVSKETAVSDEIRADRMVSAVIETSAQSGGEIAFEFSAGNQDRALQRVLMGAWSRPMEFDIFRGNHVAITANNQIVIAGDDVSAYFTDGRRIKTSGFLTAANNDYLEISNVAFAGGATTITVTGTTLVPEAGSAYTTVQDANDVVIRRLNTLRFGTGGARTIDGNGTAPFAALIAAKQIVPGQRIFVDGVGFETATVTAAAVEVDDAITLNDGVNAFTFTATDDEAEADASDLAFLIGGTDAETAANLAVKVNEMRVKEDFALSAAVAANVITLKNLNKVGGDITDEAATMTVVPFAGGDADVGGFYKVVSATGDVITVDRDVPTVAAGAPVTIKASMLRNPGNVAEITPQSATIETGFNDVSQFFVADGLRFGNLSLEVSAGAIITGSITTMGRETKRRNTTLLGGGAYRPL